MKYFSLLFLLISAVAAGQNELSQNNNPVGTTGNTNPINVQINQQEQVNYENNIYNTNNDVQQKSEGGIQIQVGSRSRGTSSPSVSYSSSGSGKKKHSFTKDISKSIKAFNYKHSGKKKFRRHSGKHSRGSILRCFN